MVGKIEDSIYGASQIQVLEGLEAVRKRPSMYIGSTSERGLHQLIFEVIDNSIDESLAGFCKNIVVVIEENNIVFIKDDGRGIPVEEHRESKRPALEVVMTVLHAGGKFNQESYSVAGGLHGVGLSVVNALAEWLEVEVNRDGKVYYQRYERGRPTAEIKEIEQRKGSGTSITFKADDTIFESIKYDYDIVAQRLRELAFLNKGLKIKFADRRIKKEDTFIYEGGISSFVQYLNKNKEVIPDDPIHIEKSQDGHHMEIALQYNMGY
ncbi:MAG: DNA topoisomerase IV subunit B, partial [Firmicutes bacterium]|nr:DNA topoisomerase IV subunit B [Bacillota bacterium]